MRMLVDAEFPVSKYCKVFDKVSAAFAVLQSIQTHTRINILIILVKESTCVLPTISSLEVKGIHHIKICRSTQRQVLLGRHLAAVFGHRIIHARHKLVPLVNTFVSRLFQGDIQYNDY
jgi:hypothetical protein